MLKNLLSFYESQLTWHWKQYAVATQPKPFLTWQVFQETWFCLVTEITFALDHFLTPKNRILEALWKQMSVYFSVRKILLGGGEGGSWGRLNNFFFKAARCLGIAKCLTILEIQPFLIIAILPTIALKDWNFPDNLDFKGG